MNILSDSRSDQSQYLDSDNENNSEKKERRCRDRTAGVVSPSFAGGANQSESTPSLTDVEKETELQQSYLEASPS